MEIIKSRYGKLAIGDQNDLIATSVLTYGEWAQNEIWLIERFVPRGGVVLDVGAYIGTHTIALSEFVGPSGLVHSFEPQPMPFAALKICVAENVLSNVTLHPFALGEQEKFVDLDMALSDPQNAGSFSLRENANVEEKQGAIAIKVLDSLELKGCDFIKIDVEGMEIFVLRGGIRTISAFRPIILCECNFLQTGAPLVEWAQTNGYIAYGVEIDAFNPHNHFGSAHNMFGDAGEVSLVLVPLEKRAQFNQILYQSGATEVSTLDGLALIMLHKPQYLAEVSARLAVPLIAASDNITKHLKTALRIPVGLQVDSGVSAKVEMPRRFQVVVPFYKNPQLVRPLFNSLLDCVDELHALNVRIFFYNDSPGDAGLREELDRCLRDRRMLDLTVVDNLDNLGFVGTVNLAFEAAIEAREDVVLLNSDTCVFPGAFLELFQVAYSDPMIGFASPRSNNATLCTIPHGAELIDLPPVECFARFQAVSHHLPRVSYVPTAVGFCLFVKWSIIVEIGGFDIQYGKGYNEENDLIMRANRLGYRAVLANHAFVWHQGEQSFGTLDIARAKREEENAKLLNSRYPEYPLLVRDYFGSAEYRAESLLGALCPDAESRLKIGFDLSNFGTYHNGTFEAGKRLLYASARCWPQDIELVVFMSRQSWDFHGLEACSRVRWVDTHQPGEKLAAIVRMGQPFDADSVFRMLDRTPVVAVFMLDTIAIDCGYLKIEFDETLWHFTMRWSNVVFTNSVFTAEQFRRRYRVGDQTLIYPSLHSVTPSDYAHGKNRAMGAEDGEDVTIEKRRCGGVLVIGNKFEHKALLSTVNQLASALPTLKITALGCSGLEQANVVFIQSGALSDDELDALYAKVDAIIFPSHYEGFGFPILHALVRKKPIYLRRLPVFEEIAMHIQVGRENIRWFESTRELVQQLIDGAAGWSGPAAVGEIGGWDRSAFEVLGVLQKQIDSASSANVADRLRWFELAFKSRTEVFNKNQGEIERATRFIGGRFERLLGKVLSNRLAFNVLQVIWRALRALRK